MNSSIKKLLFWLIISGLTATMLAQKTASTIGKNFAKLATESFGAEANHSPLNRASATEAAQLTKSSVSTCEFAAWPIPAHDKINVRWGSSGVAPVKIALVDLSGRVHFVQELEDQGANVIELNDVVPGIYLLEAEMGVERQVMKILITR